MVAPAGVNDGSTVEPADQAPADQAPAEPSEPLRPMAAAQAAPAGADPIGAQTATAAAEPAGTEAIATEPVDRGRRRRGLGVAAFVLVVIVLAGAAAGGLAVVTHGFHRKTEVTYRPAAVFKLRPGECVNFGPNGQSVTVLSCATPHDAEVFATFPLPASSWPGGAAVQQDASSGCASRLGGYLNPQLTDAGLNQEFFYPDQQAWQAGTRTVVCEVRAPTGQLTGSVRDLS